jgi:hypothetical protein
VEQLSQVVRVEVEAELKEIIQPQEQQQLTLVEVVEVEQHLHTEHPELQE